MFVYFQDPKEKILQTIIYIEENTQIDRGKGKKSQSVIEIKEVSP
jgi:hypothetical protein